MLAIPIYFEEGYQGMVGITAVRYTEITGATCAPKDSAEYRNAMAFTYPDGNLLEEDNFCVISEIIPGELKFKPVSLDRIFNDNDYEYAEKLLNAVWDHLVRSHWGNSSELHRSESLRLSVDKVAFFFHKGIPINNKGGHTTNRLKRVFFRSEDVEESKKQDYDIGDKKFVKRLYVHYMIDIAGDLARCILKNVLATLGYFTEQERTYGRLIPLVKDVRYYVDDEKVMKMLTEKNIDEMCGILVSKKTFPFVHLLGSVEETLKRKTQRVDDNYDTYTTEHGFIYLPEDKVLKNGYTRLLKWYKQYLESCNERERRQMYEPKS